MYRLISFIILLYSYSPDFKVLPPNGISVVLYETITQIIIFANKIFHKISLGKLKNCRYMHSFAVSI